MRKRPMLLFACVFLTGLAYQRYKNMFFLSGIFFAVLMEIYYGMQKRKVSVIAGRSIILLSAFLLGMGHMHKEETFRNQYLSKIEDGSEAVVWGEIKKIEQTEYSLRLILSDCYISLSKEVMPCNDVMVYTSSSHFHVGEIHKITGKVNRFSEATNEGNFDSRRYYESQKIDISMQEEECVLLYRKDYLISSLLLKVKSKLKQVYQNCMDKRAAGFYTAMILGDREGLEEELEDLFQTGGISHILAISGLHVSLLGRGLYNLLRKNKRSFLASGLFAGLILLGYCYMTGYGMSATRAVGMMLLFFVAQYLGRSYDMLNALGTVCMVLLLENPFLIEFSGFWLSVMALFGIGFVGKGLGITLMTLPVLACSYYEVPLYSVLVNIPVLALLPVLFCLALVGGVVGVLLPIVAKILLIPCGWGLSLYEWICEIVEKLPCARIITGIPLVGQMIVYYVILMIGVFWINRQSGDSKWRKRIWKMLLTIVCFCILAFPKGKELEISFLDVGQGDGIYIATGDGITYFIDGGSSDVKEVGVYRILPFLKSKGVATIDYWFVSHTDSDHISGLLEVVESGYRIRNLVLAQNCPRDENYELLINALAEADATVIYMDVGERIVTEQTLMTCLYPGNEKESSLERNEMSMVLLFEAFADNGEREISAVFSGDCSAETEKKWLNNLLSIKGVSAVPVSVFKAAHHGSNYSNSGEVLECLAPEYVVVSCSKRNRYGHPGKDAVERMENSGAEIFYTMKEGQVKIKK